MPDGQLDKTQALLLLCCLDPEAIVALASEVSALASNSKNMFNIYWVKIRLTDILTIGPIQEPKSDQSR